MPRCTVIAFGCKVNQVEAQALREALAREGFSPAAAGQPADLTVLHTCAVTAEAVRKVRQRLRSLRRNHPNTILAVTGCYVIAEAHALAQSGEVDLAARHWTQLIERLRTVALPGSATEDKRISAGGRNKQTAATQNHAGGIVITNQSTAQTPPLTPITNQPTPRVKGQFRQPLARTAAGNRATAVSDTFSRSGEKVSDTFSDAAPAAPAALAAVAGHRRHHRAFVKIQDGCDSFCAYCIVPHLRPELASKSIPDTVEEVRRLLAAGFREIVLVGIHLGKWGAQAADAETRGHGDAATGESPRLRVPASPRQPSSGGLPDLLAPLLDLAAPDGDDWRIRLSSIEAREVTDELLALMAHPRCCPHLHMPLQSGSDTVLARMNRPTSATAYLETVARARRALDRPAFTTDAIVGFPGETDADFQATLDLCREVGFLKIHTFPFSPRRGTPAATMPDQVQPKVRRDRARALRELSDDLAARYVAAFIGRRERVLIERTRTGRSTGHADRYFEIELPGHAPAGRLLNVRIESTHAACGVAVTVGRCGTGPAE